MQRATASVGQPCSSRTRPAAAACGACASTAATPPSPAPTSATPKPKPAQPTARAAAAAAPRAAVGVGCWRRRPWGRTGWRGSGRGTRCWRTCLKASLPTKLSAAGTGVRHHMFPWCAAREVQCRVQMLFRSGRCAALQTHPPTPTTHTSNLPTTAEQNENISLVVVCVSASSGAHRVWIPRYTN